MPKARRSNKRKTASLAAPLAELEFAQLIRRLTDEEGAYWFKHVLIQETVYESLLKHDRKRLHRAVAQAIERIEPDRLDEHAARLAQHYAEAGDDSKTFDYLVRAGDVAARMQANAEAIVRYSQALELANKLPVTSQQLTHLYTRRGRSLELTGDYDRALQNYDAMALTGRERGDRGLELAALMACATVHSAPTAKFDPVQAQSLSEQTLALARELDDRAAEAKVLWNLMLLNYFTGDLEQAEHFGEQSLRLAREHNLREQLGYTLNDMGRLYQALGKFESASAAYDEARTIWYELDNKPMLVDNMVGTLSQYALAGEYEKALELSDEAYHMSETIGNLWGQAYSRMSTGMIFWERGDIGRSIHRMEECMRLADQAGFLVGGVTERANLGRLYATMGDLARGFDLAHQADEKGIFLTSAGSPISALLAYLYTMAGDLDQAERDLQESYRAIGNSNLIYRKIFALLADGELALAKRDYVRALNTVEALLNDSSRLGNKFYTVDALWIKARAELGRGETANAFSTLNEARGAAEAFGIRHLLWEILAAMSDIEKERGNEAEAQVLRAEAREILDYIVDHTPGALRETFLNVTRVKRVLNN